MVAGALIKTKIIPTHMTDESVRARQFTDDGGEDAGQVTTRTHRLAYPYRSLNDLKLSRDEGGTERRFQSARWFVENRAVARQPQTMGWHPATVPGG